MRRGRAGFAITAFALLAAMGGLLVLGESPEEATPHSLETRRAASAPLAMPETLGGADRLDGSADAPLPVARTAVLADDVVSSGATVPPGVLRFEWTPPEFRELEDAVEARLMSDLRFAEQQVETGENELPLTPGRYELSLHTTGFDPIERAQIDIVSGETTDLGRLQFVPGTGVIEGYVSSSTFLTGVVVELVGDGRHPCRACGQRPTTDGDEIADDVIASPTASECATCGYADDRSTRTLDTSGRFRFGNLSGGVYRVRARHEAFPVPAEQLVELRPSGHAFVNLTLQPTTDLEVQLVASAALIEAGGAIDLDGSSVEFRFKRVDADQDLGTVRLAPALSELEAGSLAGSGSPNWAGTSFTTSNGMLVFDSSLRSALSSIPSSFTVRLFRAGPSAPQSDLGATPGWVVFDSATAPEPVLVAIDRPRVPSDSLQVAPSAPEQETIALAAKWIGPDRARIEGLPRELLMGEVRAEGGVSRYTAIDLRFGDPPMHAAVLEPYSDGDNDLRVVQRIEGISNMVIEVQGSVIRLTTSPISPPSGPVQTEPPSNH